MSAEFYFIDGTRFCKTVIGTGVIIFEGELTIKPGKMKGIAGESLWVKHDFYYIDADLDCRVIKGDENKRKEVEKRGLC